MPELPEVEMVRCSLQSSCIGRTITKVDVLRDNVLLTPARAFRCKVIGQKLQGTYRHGKQMFIEMEEGMITVHLGMTGDIVLLAEGQKMPCHARLVMTMDNGRSLVFDDQRMFGAVGLADAVESFVLEHGMGPDALSLPVDEFVAKAARTSRAIKAVLLDQSVLAGVGNLYADEALFQARLHPTTPAASLSKAKLGQLGRWIPRILRASLAVGTDFQRLPRGYLLRCRGAGCACPRGNGALRSLTVAGRTSYFCPKCQKP